MVCKDCEKFQTSVVCPEPWKAGSNNSFAGQTGRKLGENKLLSRNAKISRGNTLINKCKLCKQRVNDTHGTYCQGCAFSKGICHICGVTTLQGKEFYRSNYSEEMQEKFAPKQDANAGDADEDIQAADAKLRADLKAEKREKKRKREEKLAAAVDAAAAPAPAPASAPVAVQVPEGFVLDPASGYYHNPTTGQYYEPNSKLYCCYNNDQWFYYDTTSGEYKPWVQASTDAAANTEPGPAEAVDAPAAAVDAPAAAVDAEPAAEQAAAAVEQDATPAEPEPAPVTELEDTSTNGFEVVEFGL